MSDFEGAVDPMDHPWSDSLDGLLDSYECLPAELLRRQAQAWQERRSSILDSLLNESPELRSNKHALLDLIQHEVDLRRESGEHPTLAEYAERFPDLAEPLRVQWLISELVSVGEPAHARSAEGPGDTFSVGRFELRQRIGEGGSGVVYQAWDPQLKRVVAIKLLRAGRRASEHERERFRVEAEAIARVRHPHVLQVFDVGVWEGESYLAMEYCDQGNLAERLAVRPIDPALAAAFLLQVAEGVAAAHQVHVVHRDLKPANIFLVQPDARSGDTTPRLELPSTPSAAARQPAASPLALPAVSPATLDLQQLVPKVSDFGLAKLLDVDVEQTRTGMILGTPLYMAPEQASGNVDAVGPATDVHALGVLLYELLVGDPPYRGTTPIDTLERLCTRDPIPPRSLRPQIPRDLETIVLRCLQKHPGRRYSDAGAVAAELRRYLRGQPILARKVGQLERLVRWVRRNPVTAGLLASLFTLLLVLAVGGRLSAERLRQERDRAITSERERRQELYRSYLLEAQANRATDRVESRDASLRAVRAILQTLPRDELDTTRWAELRDETIATLARRQLSLERRWPIRTSWLEGVALNATLERLAHDAAPEAQPAGLSTPPTLGQNLTAPADPGAFVTTRLVVDERWLVELQSGIKEAKLRVLDLAQQRWTLQIRFPFRIGRLASDRRQRLYCACDDDAIRVLQLPEGTEVACSPSRFEDPSISPRADGRQLLIYSRLQPFPEIVDTESWQTIETIRECGHCTAAVWSQDCDHDIFLANAQQQLQVWNPVLHRSFVVAQGDGGRIWSLRVSPDRFWIVSNEDNGIAVLRDMRTGNPVARIPGHVLRFDATSKRLAVLENNSAVAIYRIAGNGEYTLVRQLVDGCQFSPDGQLLWLGGYLGPGVYRTDTLTRLDGDQFRLDTCGPIAVHPSGREIVSFGLFSKLQRWPLQPSPENSEVWQVGPARPVPVAPLQGLDELLPQHRGRQAVWSRDGETLIAADFRNRRVLEFDATERQPPRVIGELLNVEHVALSSDGRWVAGGAEIYPRVRVWSRAGGDPVLDLAGGQFVAFSDDGRYLAVGSSERLQVLATETWRVVREFPREAYDYLGTPVAWCPGSSSLAYVPAPGIIRLCDPLTGSTIANLTQPDRHQAAALAFSPQGHQLAFTSRQGAHLGVWNLAVLQESLLGQGITVDGLPPFSPAPRRSVTPTSVEIQRGSLPLDRLRWTENWFALADRELAAGRPTDAVGDADQAIAQVPVEVAPESRASAFVRRAEFHWYNDNLPAAQNDWQTALSVVPRFPAASLALARSHLFGPHLDPATSLGLIAPLAYASAPPPEALLILGIAQYRLADHRAALATLERVRDDDHRITADYFVAMCQAQLGMAAEGRRTFAAAQQTHQERPSSSRLLLSRQWEEARREAAALLGDVPSTSPGRSAELRGVD